MADNTTLDAGTGGDVIATDDIGGVKYQRVKITVGGDGTTLGDVAAANPLPVVNSAAVTVTGSVGVSGPVTVTGSVGIAGPATVTGSVSVAGGSVGIAGPVTVQGSVSISGVLPGPVTVTGTVAATQSGAWSISATSNIANLLGATVVAGSTVVGTIGIAKRVDTQATVGSAVNTATPLHVNEFGSLWVVAEPGDAQTTNGGGVTGVQVFMGSATTVGSVSISGVLPGPVTVTGSVGISGPVTVTGSVSAVGQVSIAGTATVALAAGTNTNEVVGDAAHGAAVSGNPVLVGFEGRSTDQTAVSSGQVSRVLATLLGKIVNHPYAIPAQYTSYAMVTAGLATTVALTAWASAGASTRWYITSAQFINQGAAVTRALIQDGAGAVYFTASLATAGGGVSATFPVPLRIAANQTVELKLDTTGTTVYGNFQGFKAAE